MKVLIISGGTSSERKISLISADAVKKAIEQLKHEVTIYDLKKGYDQLKKVIPKHDVVIPVIHGEEGEGGTLHKFLLKQEIPFVGAHFKSLQQGWFKIPFKKFCDKNNITHSKWKKVKNHEDVVTFGFPSVLKSSNGGSSREVVILKTEKDTNSASYKKLIASDDELFVERFLPGVEITVGIVDGKALPVLEIRPPEGKWFDYKNKYDGSSQEIPFAPSLDMKLQKRVQKLAEDIHKQLNLGHYSRIDFIIHKEIPHALEVNTIPGLTPGSLMPKAAQAAGLEFHEFIAKLLSLATKKPIRSI